MQLRDKTTLILLVLLIACTVVISLFVSAISLASYSDLERAYITRDLGNAVNQIDQESVTLFSLVSDWGPWDDTYEYIGGGKPGYLDANLLPETYHNLRLNIIIIADRNGRIVYGGSYNFTTDTPGPVPDSLRPFIRPGEPLMQIADPRSGARGLLRTPDGILLVASRPVVRTDFSGEPRGVVIMGRYLNSDEVARIARLTNPSLRIIPRDDPGLTPDLLFLFAKNPDPARGVVRVIDSARAEGYAGIQDIYGNESLILQILQDRDIYQQGVQTTLLYILIVLATGLFLGIGILYIVDSLVLTRITEMSRQVSVIAGRMDLSQRISLSEDDEFAGLATDINRMVETIGKTQEGLQASEARFRELTELLPQTIFEMDLSGRLLYINRAGMDIFGITESWLRDSAVIHQFLIPEDVERMRQGLAAILAGARSPGEIYTLRMAGGGLMRAIVYTAPIHRDGSITGFRGILLDVTDRIELEEALTESQEYLQTLLMSLSVGVMVVDSETRTIVDANPAALEMIGATKDQIIHRPCQDILCPSEGGACPVSDLHLETDNAQRSLRRSDGTTLAIIKQVVPVMLHGRPCLLETFIDNTARMQMQEQLRESRERLSSILRASPVGVYETTRDGELVYVNERWEEMTGMTLESVRERNWSEILHPLDKTRISKEMWKKFQALHQPQAEYRFMRPDGKVIWIYRQCVPMNDPDGNVRGYVGTITDITGRKRNEEAITLANKKLNLMNNITRHDILNTITGLFGLIDMAVATNNTAELPALLAQIKDLGAVIQRQITFTREYQDVGVHAPAWQNIGEIISRANQNFRNAGITFAVDIENIEVFADPLLEKVFYNLVDNALRYGEHVTRISFTARISDEALTLICEDDGIGIAEPSKEKIFERGVGKNTGMGLFLTREILLITGIRIREEGILGRGARFVMVIPHGTWRFGPGTGG